jgi:hypothetical protein
MTVSKKEGDDNEMNEFGFGERGRIRPEYPSPHPGAPASLPAMGDQN